MLKQLFFITLISFTIVSCSTRRHVNQQDTSRNKPKVEAEKAEKVKHQKKISIKDKLEIHYQKYKAVPYKYGGTTSKGFDCSGFVQKTYRELFQINLPRTTRLMMNEGSPISKKRLKIGDLVFFKTSRKYRHVGIFMGENQFIHVSTKKGVMKSSLSLPYWLKHYMTSRRVF